MSNKKHNAVVEYLKDSFLEFLKIVDTRYNENYTFDMRVDRYIVNEYTDSYKILLQADYEDSNMSYYLIAIFYDEDDVHSLFSGDKKYNIPDIVSIELIECKLTFKSGRIMHIDSLSNAHRIITGTTMSMSELLDETDLAGMFIEDFLLG